jgi:integrase-like protein
VPQAQNLLMDLQERGTRFLVRDRAGQFLEGPGAALSAAGIQVGKIPPRSPRANADADRQVLTVRSEVTDRMLIAGPWHLRVVLGEYATHDNRHRPHRARNLRPPDSDEIIMAAATGPCGGEDPAAEGPGRTDQRVPTSSMTTVGPTAKPQLKGHDGVVEPHSGRPP